MVGVESIGVAAWRPAAAFADNQVFAGRDGMLPSLQSAGGDTLLVFRPRQLELAA